MQIANLTAWLQNQKKYHTGLRSGSLREHPVSFLACFMNQGKTICETKPQIGLRDKMIMSNYIHVRVSLKGLNKK